MAFPENIILRTVIQAPYTTKGAELTWQELDGNIILLADEIISLGGNIAPFDIAFPYVGGQVYYVSYNNNIWKFVSATTQTGVVPGTDPLIWELSSIGAAVAAGNIIIRTMFDATTDAGLAQLVVGATYLITGCYSIGSNTVDIYIKALTAMTFEAFGYCSYINTAMSTTVECYIGYDLIGNYSGIADYIFYLYNALYDNEISQNTGVDTISKYPLDAPQYSSGVPTFAFNRFSNVEGTWSAAKNWITRTTAKDCTIDTSGTTLNDTAVIFNCVIGPNAVVTISSDTAATTFGSFGTMLLGAILQADVDDSAIATVSRASINGRIGRFMTVDTTNFVAGYSGYGTCEGGISTFVVRGDQLLALNPNVSREINITDASFAGTLIITDTTTEVNIETITYSPRPPLVQQYTLLNESTNPVNVIHDITKLALQANPVVISNNGFDRLAITTSPTTLVFTELYHTNILP